MSVLILLSLAHKSMLKFFKKELKIKTIILKEKSQLVQTLAKETKNGDLILFSNDAPSFM